MALAEIESPVEIAGVPALIKHPGTRQVWLVPGAAGFIGRNLSDTLLQMGDEVIGVDNLVSGSPENAEALSKNSHFTFVLHDITVPRPEGFGPHIDKVINLACPASPKDFRTLGKQIALVNADGTVNMLDVAKDHGATFLQASTSETYGDPEKNPQPETYRGNVNTLGPRSPYDEGKRFAEALTMLYNREFGVDTRIVRIFNTYGPHMRKDDGRVVTNFVDQALTGQPMTIYGDGQQTRSLQYISDLVRGLLKLEASGYKQPVNIGNPDEMTVQQIAELIKKLADSKSGIIYQAALVDDPRKRQPDITRARTLLQWEPEVLAEEGLKRTIEYFKTH